MIPECKILIGDVRARLKELPDESVQCVVTSPPYWGLRFYQTIPQVWGGNPKCQHAWGDVGSRHRGGPPGKSETMAGRDQLSRAATGDINTGCFCACGAWRGELGLEPTPDLFVEHIVEVFREVRRVLRSDGTCWVNMGDCYATGAGKVGDCPGGGAQGAKWRGDPRPAVNGRGEEQIEHKGHRGVRLDSAAGKHDYNPGIGPMIQPNRMPIPGLKPKDLVGQPWRVAFALQADGWWLRSDIIWHKPSPMPESVTDRPTKAHEYIFLLTKAARYKYDAEAIKEPVTGAAHARGNGVNPKAGLKDEGRTAQGLRTSTRFGRGAGFRVKQNESFSAAVTNVVDTRNARSVWSIPSEPYPYAHYATFPTAIPRRCILAGTKVGDTVLDPFGGSGTVGQVALEYGRNVILIDLNPANEALMRGRMAPHEGQGVLTETEVDL